MNTPKQLLAADTQQHQSTRIGSHTSSLGVVSWSDAQLISSVLCDPPDKAALEALVTRYSDVVFRRCYKLTANHDKAQDLAQAAWYQLLRKRHMLKPDGNFPAYIIMIATNLFRDSYRAARRAGPMGEHQFESLDAPHGDDEGNVAFLEGILPDVKTIASGEQIRIKIDIHAALERVTPQSREVLVARFIKGDSCAEIGLRHGRTEQAVSRWVREGLREMKSQMENPAA